MMSPDTARCKRCLEICIFSSSDLDNGSAVATAHVRAYSLNRGFMSTTALPIKPAQLAPNGVTGSAAAPPSVWSAILTKLIDGWGGAGCLGASKSRDTRGVFGATACDVLIHPALDCHANLMVRTNVQLIRLSGRMEQTTVGYVV